MVRLSDWRGGEAVTQGSAKPPYTGSIPVRASKIDIFYSEVYNPVERTNMATKEGIQQPQGAVDKGLAAWQTWNKLTLTAEGTAVVGGLLFGVPWLVALGAAGAAIDGVQIVAIDHIQEQRRRAQSSENQPTVRRSQLARAA